MTFVDPRTEYDDLYTTESHERLPPEAFAENAGSEPDSVGWVVLGLVLDDNDRVLLIDQPWADGWLVPGGVPKPGESLSEAVVRELGEETGVEITPVRPHAVDELVVENELTGETGGWTTVVFEADAETTAIDDDPGVEDEEIRDARWFDGLPHDVFNPEPIEAVYERCRRDP